MWPWLTSKRVARFVSVSGVSRLSSGNSDRPRLLHLHGVHSFSIVYTYYIMITTSVSPCHSRKATPQRFKALLLTLFQSPKNYLALFSCLFTGWNRVGHGLGPSMGWVGWRLDCGIFFNVMRGHSCLQTQWSQLNYWSGGGAECGTPLTFILAANCELVCDV